MLERIGEIVEALLFSVLVISLLILADHIQDYREHTQDYHEGVVCESLKEEKNGN